MDTSNVCPTEDAIQGFLDYLVDPLLPVKFSMHATPPLSKQKEVAKQVHAVVLLYNYYHRKRHPHMEYLDFQQFCKLAIVLKPNLMSYMNFMQRTDDAELNDLDKQLSLTEKAIKDACDICASLDTSKNTPSTKGCPWPISKVAVLLIDSAKENCFLQDGSITKGVRSLIEQDVNESCCSSEGSIEGKNTTKRKRIPTKHLQDELGANDGCYKQIAFSAVKEATNDGISQSDITVKESHVVCSLSKEKSATRFYIMQCSCVGKDIARWIPIKDVIDSLQGPLLLKSSSKWMHSSVVEYFHLLPYSQIISHLFSRDQGSVLELVNVSSPKMTEEHCEPEVSNDNNRNRIIGGELKDSGNVTIAESEKQFGKNKRTNDVLDVTDGPCNMDVDNHAVLYSDKRSTSKNVVEKVKHNILLEKTNYCEESDINGKTNDSQFEVVDSKFQIVNHPKGQNFANKKATRDNTSQHVIPVNDRAPVILESNFEYSAKLQKAVASKAPVLSETALKVLHTKRDKLVLQQRNIEDEIALCDKKIQEISDGDVDDLLELKIDLIIEGCNDVSLKSDSQWRTPHDNEDQCSAPCIKRTRVLDKALNKRNPCQELDGLCNNNNWTLPTYQVFPADGGYQAKVTIKLKNFEHSSVGVACPKPTEARGSAAAQMLIKLGSMLTPAQ